MLRTEQMLSISPFSDVVTLAPGTAEQAARAAAFAVRVSCPEGGARDPEGQESDTPAGERNGSSRSSLSCTIKLSRSGAEWWDIRLNGTPRKRTPTCKSR